MMVNSPPPNISEGIATLAVSDKLKIIATAIWNKNDRSKDRINVWDSRTHKLKQTLINCRVAYGENISICEDKNILKAGGEDSKLYLYNLNDISTEGVKPYQIISGINQCYESTYYIPKHD